jgi:glutathione S-transferase
MMLLQNLVPLAVFGAILVLFWTGVKVGMARGRYGIKAPAVSGHPDFERFYRVQMNTVEQAVVFFPALWLCTNYFRADVAGIAGLVWVVGRVWYALGYYRDAAKRGAGFTVSVFAFGALLACGGFGLIRQLIGY